MGPPQVGPGAQAAAVFDGHRLTRSSAFAIGHCLDNLSRSHSGLQDEVDDHCLVTKDHRLGGRDERATPLDELSTILETRMEDDGITLSIERAVERRLLHWELEF